jgi:hypothetical protein
LISSSGDAQLVRYLGCLSRKLLGFDLSEIVLRQAPVSVKINWPNTACLSVPIANSLCSRDIGAIHERDLFVG